jgi:hypothetical protein
MPRVRLGRPAFTGLRFVEVSRAPSTQRTPSGTQRDAMHRVLVIVPRARRDANEPRYFLLENNQLRRSDH